MRSLLYLIVTCAAFFIERIQASVASVVTTSYTAPTVDAVSPRGVGIPTGGGAVIVLSGKNFSPVNGTIVSARYGVNVSYVVRDCVTVAPATVVICVSIPGVGAHLPWRITIGEQESSPSINTVSYLPPVIRAVFGAAMLPTRGGTIFNLSGENFGPLQESGSVLYYDTTRWALVPCVVREAHVGMQCTSVEGAGKHPLVLFVGGQRSAFVPGIHASYGAPVVESVNASLLTTSGGNPITIFGQNFGPVGVGVGDVLLSYGGSNGTSFTASGCAVIEGHVAMKCMSGDGVGTNLRLKLIVLNVSSSLSPTSVHLSYTDPFVATVDPISGPISGGSLITLSGTNFGSHKGIVLLGTVKCVVSMWTHLTVKCQTTSVGQFCALVPFVISIANRSSSNASVSFYYYEVTSLYPRFGPSVGGTNVTIHGRGFVVGLQASIASTFSSGLTFGMATSDSTVEFVSNPAVRLCITCNVTFNMTLNGRDYCHVPGQFEMYALPKLQSITPFFGPDSGGTSVNVRFVESLFVTPVMTARFALSSALYRNTTCTRTSVSGLQAVCISPSLQMMREALFTDAMRYNFSISIDKLEELYQTYILNCVTSP